MAKMKVYYLLLGIGIGVILTSSLNIALNKPKKVEYSEQEIIDKARGLGMVTVKENIESNSKKNNEQNKQDKQNEQDKDKEIIVNEEPKEDVNKATPVQVSQNKKPQVTSEEASQPKEVYKVIRINNGDTAIEIAKKLKAAGIIDSEENFLKFVTDRKLQGKFVSKEYQVKMGLSYEELLNILTEI